MEKEVTAQQRGKSRHSAAALKKKTLWGSMEKGFKEHLCGKVVIV